MGIRNMVAERARMSSKTPTSKETITLSPEERVEALEQQLTALQERILVLETLLKVTASTSATTRKHGRPKQPVMIEGLRFVSVTAAAKAAGLNVKSVIYRLNSPNFPKWNYVDE